MDMQAIKSEATPGTEPEVISPVGVEAAPIAETVTDTPTTPPPTTDASQGTTLDPESFVPAQDDVTIPKAEVSDLTSPNVEKLDENWTARVRDVIKNDEGQPAKEEADAEVLNEEYMKNRFNVDVDAPVEEK